MPLICKWCTGGGRARGAERKPLIPFLPAIKLPFADCTPLKKKNFGNIFSDAVPAFARQDSWGESTRWAPPAKRARPALGKTRKAAKTRKKPAGNLPTFVHGRRVKFRRCLFSRFAVFEGKSSPVFHDFDFEKQWQRSFTFPNDYFWMKYSKYKMAPLD